MINTVLREPLIHFLLLSVCIFLFSPSNEAAHEKNGSSIVISENDIAHHMQGIDTTLTREQALNRLAALPTEQRQYLVQQRVENEVLYREAVNLGLDQQDPVVRQRLIQRMRFMLQGLQGSLESDEQAVQNYFKKNRANYASPPKVSFKHVFFKASESDAAAAKARALAALGSGQAVTGDAFPYHKAYLDRTEQQISGHFGAEFAAALMQLEAEPETMQGPIESTFGYHLVKVTSRHPEYVPSFSEVEARVLADFKRTQTRINERNAIAALMENYQITVPTWLQQNSLEKGD